MTSQASNPWTLAVGGTVLVGEITFIYAVADLAFTTVEIAQDCEWRGGRGGATAT